MSLPFSYEDRAPDTSLGEGFGVTNEETHIFRDLLRGKLIINGLGIASAGEVTFFNLLPKVQSQLVLIDHSYRSLYAFCVKALLLVTLGAAETRKLFIAGDNKLLEAAILKVKDAVPARMHLNEKGGFWADPVLAAYASLRTEWLLIDPITLRRTIANLHKIKLVHGDMTDVQDRAPYDFLYLSNALEHTGRKGVLRPATLSSYLTPNAWVLWALAGGGTPYGQNAIGAKEWEPVLKVRGTRTQWSYHLSKANTKPSEEVVRLAASI